MFSYRRFTATALTLTLPVALVACSSASAGSSGDDSAPLKILASSTPHAEILEWIDERDDAFTLDVSTADDGPNANGAVENGSVDANFFQHLPYLRDWEAQTGKTLVNLAGTHIEPMSLYSTKVADLAQLPDGARIAIPASSSNLARALLLLQDNGLIELRGDVDPNAVTTIGLNDIASNPRDLEIVTVDDALTMHTINDTKVTGVIASTNYALEAGFDPVDDALITESAEDNPYTNIFVTREELKDDPRITQLAADLTSAETADWIRETYGNAVIPVNH